MNDKFLREAREIEANWTKRGLKLGDLLGRTERSATASMLECQRLFKETGERDCCDECRNFAKLEEESLASASL